MASLALFYHPDALKHDTGPGHPERPARLETIMNHLLASSVWQGIEHRRPDPVQLQHVYRVHSKHYITLLQRRCQSGERLLDEGDTVVCPDSYHAALLAAGAVTAAVDYVLAGSQRRAFCAVRPPGHHAGTSRAMGFCLLNNVALGARYAREQHSIDRVAIVDWDVHHGNGTQEIFYEDDTVLYCSLHQYPFYPGTGARTETGAGKGEGFTVNCPLPALSGEKEYAEAFEGTIVPAVEQFKPQLLLISAGFDAHRDDPIANMKLTEGSFALFTSLMVGLASSHCAGRIVSVLEGGYNVEALAKSVEKHLAVMRAG